MTHTDPIADLLTRIRNAYKAEKKELICPSSSLKVSLMEVLKKSGYIADFSIEQSGQFPDLKIKLDPEKKIRFIKRVSKPGQRIYTSNKNIKKTLSGIGISVISTSQGVMTGDEAKKKKIGGEILCEIA